MCEGCCHPAGKVEGEEFQVSEVVLDIISEYPQEEHIAGDMEHASMEEEAREYGYVLCRRKGGG